MKYYIDFDSAMAFAGSWAEMELNCHPKDDPYYQGYVSGMAEMIYLIYEDDIDEDDSLYDIEDFIKGNCLYFSRRKLGLPRPKRPTTRPETEMEN